jgi:hypothetical protein
MSRNELFLKSTTGELVTYEDRYKTIILLKFLIRLDVITGQTAFDAISKFQIVFV